jgi:hypothetical protein
MSFKFYSRTDVKIFTQELMDNYSDETYKVYEHYIDNLFVCGLTLSYDPKCTEAYWRFGSDYTYSSDFFKFGDPSILVIIFKGLVICEFHILKNRINSVSPVTFLNSILIKRLSTSLYNEIAQWALSYPANDHYRKRSLKPIFRSDYLGRSNFQCSSCSAYSKISKEETKLTYSEYLTISQSRKDKRKLARNKCPKCKQHQLKTDQTRWGRVRICSSYPQCDFVEKL